MVRSHKLSGRMYINRPTLRSSSMNFKTINTHKGATLEKVFELAEGVRTHGSQAAFMIQRCCTKKCTFEALWDRCFEHNYKFIQTSFRGSVSLRTNKYLMTLMKAKLLAGERRNKFAGKDKFIMKPLKPEYQACL